MNGVCEFNGNFPACLNSPADGSFWLHLKSCPDCRALLHAYREFQEPAAEVEIAFDLNEADLELKARLGATIPWATQPTTETKSLTSSLPFWSRKEFWYSSAAILMVGAGLFLNQDWRMNSDFRLVGNSEYVRGVHSSTDQYFCIREQGLLQISWPQFENSDLTRIIIFDASMVQLGCFSSTQPEPFQISDPNLLNNAVFGQIIHLGQGDILMRSPLFTIPPNF